MVVATDLHRVYIQMLLARRAMPAEVALEMYKRAVSAVMQHDPEFTPTHRRNKEGHADFLQEVSTLLEPLGMSIKRGNDERNGRPWIALCNTEGGTVAQQATDLTSLEISYLRIVIEAIVNEYPGFSVGSLAALNLARTVQGNITQSDAQSLLDALVSRNWLLKSERGRFSLAPRAMLELDHYLRETYGDNLLSCRRCERLMMTGVRCENGDCNASYHLYCFDRLRGVNGACMACQAMFAEVQPTAVGERAVPRTEDGHRRASHRKRKRGVRHIMNGNGHAAASDDEDGDQDEGEADLEEEEVDGGRTQSQTSQSQSQSHGGPETIIPDSIVDEEDEDSPPRRSSRRR